ncbi:MAG: hypothetical protein IT158_19610 [Bryobacterales bacterium]|nr:hypothetical protein [Bryobacterales bacterium]
MSIWDKFPNYDDSELELLVRSAAETLADAGQGSRVPEDALEMSDRAAAEEIRADLSGLAPAATSDQIRSILRDPEASRRISLAALDEVRKQPGLAGAVEAAYQQRMRKLGGPELLLAVAPLLLLVLRIESFKWKDLQITFGNSSDAVKAAVAGVVSGLTGKAGSAS